MPIIAKKKASNPDFIPAPAGAHAAVCVDVVDLGMLEVTYGNKKKSQHKIRIVWQIAEMMADYKPYLVSRRYTNSLHEKASLRKDLESWRGKPFTEAELNGFDLENLLGAACYVNVIHNVKDGDTFANVTSIMRLPKGMEAPKARDYVRVCDRPAEDQQHDDGAFAGITDDDVPF